MSENQIKQEELKNVALEDEMLDEVAGGAGKVNLLTGPFTGRSGKEYVIRGSDSGPYHVYLKHGKYSIKSFPSEGHAFQWIQLFG